MSAASTLTPQASQLKALLLNADDSEILGHADELLLFLHRPHDVLLHGSKLQIPLSSIDDIIQGLESNPGATLQDKNVRARLINLFAKLTRLQAYR